MDYTTTTVRNHPYDIVQETDKYVNEGWSLINQLVAESVIYLTFVKS